MFRCSALKVTLVILCQLILLGDSRALLLNLDNSHIKQQCVNCIASYWAGRVYCNMDDGGDAYVSSYVVNEHSRVQVRILTGVFFFAEAFVRFLSHSLFPSMDFQ